MEPWTDRVKTIFESARSWGRWGDADGSGALNLVTHRSTCAAHGLCSFLFQVAPLRVDQGTGSPMNPIAVL